MPNCFALTDKTTNTREYFDVIDDKIRAHFGVPADPDNYYMGWYGIIGFRLALGQSFDMIARELQNEGDTTLLDICDWLNLHYTSEAWAQRK
jgi:hypothetical protein